MSRDFDHLHVAVTGGTGALGTAVIRQLVNEGATCHVPSLFPAELEHFAFKEHPQVHIVESVDLTRESSVERFYLDLPPLWASIQCAGGFDMAPLEATTLHAFERLMNMNATSCFLCCREAVRNIHRRPDRDAGGRLVNVAARPALEPRSGSGMVAYTMSKAAVAALTASLAEELKDEKIWVNAVAPSILDTPANRAAMPDADPSLWASLDEVAETITFLASPRNGTTRGGIVPVYGRS